MLKKSASKEALSQNIATEIKAGKRPDVAAAIAYYIQRKAKREKAKSK